MITTPQLFQAIAANPATGKPSLPTITNSGKESVIYLYDSVSKWTPAAATEFQKALDAIKSPVINVRINSPGGAVFEGLAIYQLLKAHPAKVIVHIDGIAASIASVIALAGDEIRIAEGAMMMIHDASISTTGNASQLHRDADLVEKISQGLTDIYINATGKPRAIIRAAMEKETWYSADEAVSFGLAHNKVVGIKAAAAWSPAGFPDIPAKALAAAGITARQTQRAMSAEIDRITAQNLLLREKLADKFSAASDGVLIQAATHRMSPEADKVAAIAALEARGITVSNNGSQVCVTHSIRGGRAARLSKSK